MTAYMFHKKDEMCIYLFSLQRTDYNSHKALQVGPLQQHVKISSSETNCYIAKSQINYLQESEPPQPNLVTRVNYSFFPAAGFLTL